MGGGGGGGGGGCPDATPYLWKQPFSAVRASGGYPGNVSLFDMICALAMYHDISILLGYIYNIIFMSDEQFKER